jgi:ferric-dicitrate binding protein FerR (iron transport regulator)
LRDHSSGLPARDTEKKGSRVWFYSGLAAAMLLIGLILGGIFLLLTREPPQNYRSADQILRVSPEEHVSAELRPNSLLRPHLLPTAGTGRAWYLEGEGWFELDGRDSPFVLYTPELRISGTDSDAVFLAGSFAGTTRVWLESGSLELSHSETQVIHTLEAGQAAKAGSQGFTGPPYPADGIEFTGWRTGRLELNERKARDVIAELASYYGITLHASGEVLEMRLSGSIPLGTLSETLGELGGLLSGEFREAGAGTFRFSQDS